MLQFPFYAYDKVIAQDEADRYQTYRREEFFLYLGNYKYANSKQLKLDYCILEPGHYIHVLDEDGGQPQVGLFINILWCEGSAFIAYTRPKITHYDQDPRFFCRSLKISNIMEDSVLYVVPKRSFLQRAYVYNVNEDYSEIIRYQ